MKNSARLNIKSLLSTFFKKSGISASIKSIDDEIFGKKILDWEYGVGFNSYTGSTSSSFLVLSQVSERDKSHGHLEKLINLPPFDNIFSIIHLDNQFVVKENFRFKYIFNNENRRDIVFNIDRYEILKVDCSDFSFYILINCDLYRVINELLEKSLKFVNFVKEVILIERSPKIIEKDLILKVDDPQEFMAGRFFLPQVVSNKPVLTETVFKDIRLSRSNSWLKKWSGLCFKITFNLFNNEVDLFYLFDVIDIEKTQHYKTLFSRLLKIIIKSNIKHLNECDIKISNISAKIIQKPENSKINNTIQLRYYLKSRESIALGRVIIPNPVIANILLKIAPEWSIVFTEDSLLNKLKSFLSLNRELYSQGRLSLIESDNSSTLINSKNPVTNLKLNFIKLHQVTNQLSLRESRRLITNHLYPNGWSGLKLKRIFYYSRESIKSETTQIYPLAFFNEERFLNYLLKNMKDEWIHNSDKRFNKIDKICLTHFKILHNLYNDKKYNPSIKLKTILDETFSIYYSKVDSIFNKLRSDLSYIKHIKIEEEKVKELFNNHLELKKIYYHFPEHLDHLDSILERDQITKIKQLEVKEPENIDDWLENLISFKSKLT